MCAKRTDHVPVRMCVVCRERFPKGELTRYVLNDGESAQPVPDPGQVLPGRGFYVCDQARCREVFRQRRGLKLKRKGENR